MAEFEDDVQLKKGNCIPYSSFSVFSKNWEKSQIIFLGQWQLFKSNYLITFLLNLTWVTAFEL